MKKKLYGAVFGLAIALLVIGIFISHGYQLNQLTPNPYFPLN